MPDNFKTNEQGSRPSAKKAMGLRPGGMGGSTEKAENFGNTIKSLVIYCKRFLPIILIAVLLAMVGAMLNIIGPDMTNLIKEGLAATWRLSAECRNALRLISMGIEPASMKVAFYAFQALTIARRSRLLWSVSISAQSFAIRRMSWSNICRR